MTSLPSPPATYEFARYQLSVEERLLRRDGVPISIFPKAFDVLVVLVENCGRLVTKEELLRRVWPDTFVQESNLSQSIHVLRKALGSGDEDQTFIETVPRRGYRFTASVLPVPADAPSSVSETLSTTEVVMAESAEVTVTSRSTTHVVIEVADDSPPKSDYRRAILLSTALASVVIGGGLVFSSAWRSERTVPAAVVRAPMARLERLTTDSTSHEPAISPDGRFIAYRVSDSEEQTVWLKNIATGSAVQILPPIPGGYSSLTFSRDGDQLLYKTVGTSDTGTVVRVPLFGGTPQLVATNVWSDFGLSPDGTEIAFLRANGALEHQLVAANLDDGRERIVVTLADQHVWHEVGNTSPSWSPDGTRLVVCGGWRDGTRGWTFGLFEVPASGGTLKRVPSPPWNRIAQVAWLGDGSGMVVVGRNQQRDPYQVWLLEVPSGQARRLTNDLHDYNKLRVSPDSKLIAIEQQIAFRHLWVANLNDPDTARRITHGARSEDGYYGLSWTPDGRILFASSRTGESEIFTSRPDGSDLRQLTRDSTEWNTNGRMTGDGRWIVFSSGRNGEANIWRMDSDGSNVVQLTHGKSVFSPTLTPDGQWVYYVNAYAAPSRIERVSIEGGTPQVVFDGEAAEVPVISPDGRWIAFSLYSERTGWRAAILPTAGGTRRLFPWHGVRGFVRWSADSRSLLFMKRQGNVSNVWTQPLDGSAPRPITSFNEQFIWNFAPSPDGKQIAFSRGSSVSDIVLVRNFRTMNDDSNEER